MTKAAPHWEINNYGGKFYLYNFGTEVAEIYDPELANYIFELLERDRTVRVKESSGVSVEEEKEFL